MTLRIVHFVIGTLLLFGALVVASPLFVEHANGSPPVAPRNSRDVATEPPAPGLSAADNVTESPSPLLVAEVSGWTASDPVEAVPSSSSNLTDVPNYQERRPPVTAMVNSADQLEQRRQAIPSSIRIPVLSIDAPVVPVGITAEGIMEAPQSYDAVGWWQFGARPGEQGRAVLAGHVDSTTGPAVFFKLDQLQPGDEIYVTGNGQSAERRFIVMESALYLSDHAPLESIFGASGRQELILITCGGEYDPASLSYRHRRVIYAELAVG